MNPATPAPAVTTDDVKKANSEEEIQAELDKLNAELNPAKPGVIDITAPTGEFYEVRIQDTDGSIIKVHVPKDGDTKAHTVRVPLKDGSWFIVEVNGEKPNDGIVVPTPVEDPKSDDDEKPCDVKPGDDEKPAPAPEDKPCDDEGESVKQLVTPADDEKPCDDEGEAVEQPVVTVPEQKPGVPCGPAVDATLNNSTKVENTVVVNNEVENTVSNENNTVVETVAHSVNEQPVAPVAPVATEAPSTATGVAVAGPAATTQVAPEQKLAETGASNVALFAGLGAASLLAGALVLGRRKFN